jgi:hypothetical protein
VPGENISRRVARAAAVGGGRAYRNRTPFGWYTIVTLICVLGLALVGYSRYERTHPAVAATKAAVPPTKANAWEAALSLDLCGKISQLPLSSNAGQAFTTDGKGVIDIEPARSSTPLAFSGNNANLGAFLTSAQVVLTPTSLQIPPAPPVVSTTTTSTTKPGATTTTNASSSTSTTNASSSTSTSSTSSTTTTTLPPKTYHNGDHCKGKPGLLQVETWKSAAATSGTIVTRTATSLKFENGQLITIAFLPKGATIPKPTAAKRVADYVISNPAGLVQTVTAPSTTTTVAPASSVPATTKPATGAPTSTTSRTTSSGGTK